VRLGLVTIGYVGDYVPSVNKVLRAPIFLHPRNFETERYTQEKH